MTGQPPTAPEPMHAARHTLIKPAGSGHRPQIDVTPPATGRANDASLAELSVHLDRGERRITVGGEFDAAAAPVVAALMAMLPVTDPGDITIDLSRVRFIDAGGLGCLVGCANQLAARGAKLRVAGASARLRRVVDIARLGSVLHT